MQIRVVPGPQKGLRVAAHQFGVQVGNDGDLILPPTTARMPRISGSANAALTSAALASGLAPTRRVVGYSTGTRPVTSVNRRIACS